MDYFVDIDEFPLPPIPEVEETSIPPSSLQTLSGISSSPNLSSALPERELSTRTLTPQKKTSSHMRSPNSPNVSSSHVSTTLSDLNRDVNYKANHLFCILTLSACCLTGICGYFAKYIAILGYADFYSNRIKQSEDKKKCAMYCLLTGIISTLLMVMMMAVIIYMYADEWIIHMNEKLYSFLWEYIPQSPGQINLPQSRF